MWIYGIVHLTKSTIILLIVFRTALYGSWVIIGPTLFIFMLRPVKITWCNGKFLDVVTLWMNLVFTFLLILNLQAFMSWSRVIIVSLCRLCYSRILQVVLIIIIIVSPEAILGTWSLQGSLRLHHCLVVLSKNIESVSVGVSYTLINFSIVFHDRFLFDYSLVLVLIKTVTRCSSSVSHKELVVLWLIVKVILSVFNLDCGARILISWFTHLFIIPWISLILDYALWLFWTILFVSLLLIDTF